jgi:pantoate kinase
MASRLAPSTRTLTINAAANDSGALAINYSANVPITIGLSVSAACAIPPVSAMAVVQSQARQVIRHF